MEKINNGNITASKNGNLEFSSEIKKEEIKKFFNSYLHLLGEKNKEKDILLVGSSEKLNTLLNDIKDALMYFNQAVSVTDASTLNMAKILLENQSFQELIYITLNEKNKSYSIILTKGKRRIRGSALFSIMEKINYYNSRPFGVSRCSYIKNDITYKHRIIQIINSIYLLLKNEENSSTISKKVFLDTENSFIKNESAKIYTPFGLSVKEKNDEDGFTFKIDAAGENIEEIKYGNKILNRDNYLRYLEQKEIRNKFKIVIRNKNIYFIYNNFPIISQLGRKMKDVLCEVYLFIMISDSKDFWEYSQKNNYIIGGE